MVNIEVCNKFGAVIDRVSTNSSKFKLNVSGYASGIYFVKIMHGELMEVKKFIRK